MRAFLISSLLVVVARAGEPVFVETVLARTDCYVREPVTVTLRISYDEQFFARQAVQMFHQHFDLPVKVDAAWLSGSDGAVRNGSDTIRTSFALNDDGVRGVRVDDRVIGGRAYAVVELARTLTWARPGEVRLDAPALHYVFGTRFEEDFIHGRVATDQIRKTVRGKPLELYVRPLPAEGRPDGYTGAVGHFTVEAEASHTAVTVDEMFRLTLRIRGVGNFETFDAPRLDALEFFHVLGQVEASGRQSGKQGRTIRYDLTATSAYVKALPAIAFSYFDTRAPAGYRTVETRPIPITVRGGPDTGEDSAPTQPVERKSSPRRFFWVGLLLLAVAAALMWRVRKARTAEHPVVTAATDFRAAVDGDVAGAFTVYLAARLDCPAATVIGPGLGARLEASGVPRDAAVRATALVERLVGARYGGAAIDAEAHDAAQVLVDELERAWN